MRAEPANPVPVSADAQDHPGSIGPRATEVALWRAALALVVDNAGIDESRGDAALAAVVRHTPRPERVSESRLIGMIIDSATDGGEKPVDELAWRLVRIGGVPVDVAAHALGLGEDAARSLAAGVDARTDAGEVRAWAAHVAAADAYSALLRVDAETAGLRRRRQWVNALKFIAYGVVVGLVVYAMFDLRRAGDAEREKRTPADLFSLPMPKQRP